MRNLTHRWPQSGEFSSFFQFFKKDKVDLPPPPSSYVPACSATYFLEVVACFSWKVATKASLEVKKFENLDF